MIPREIEVIENPKYVKKIPISEIIAYLDVQIKGRELSNLPNLPETDLEMNTVKIETLEQVKKWIVDNYK